MNRLQSKLALRARKADALQARSGAVATPSKPAASRSIRRVRHDIKVRHVAVASVQHPSPGFVSIRLQGDDLIDFPSQSFDDHIKVFVPQDGAEAIRRDYTPRCFDAATGDLTIEFALHEGGAASDWASRLQAGDRVQVAGPKGSMVIPMDYQWYWLIGDPTSLPAISRFLEEAPVGCKVTVVCQITNEGDQREFATAANADVYWVSDYQQLLATVHELELPAGEGFVWGGLEGHTVARLRTMVLEQKGHPREHSKLSAYWKQGLADFSEKG